MAGLPTGTVTFLFTDIEGSTRLLQELGDLSGSTVHPLRIRCIPVFPVLPERKAHENVDRKNST